MDYRPYRPPDQALPHVNAALIGTLQQQIERRFHDTYTRLDQLSSAMEANHQRTWDRLDEVGNRMASIDASLDHMQGRDSAVQFFITPLIAAITAAVVGLIMSNIIGG